jgi:NAD(P)-dependent dehydrogenase (short-subunit alcohol dehydrogenase family)
MDIKLNGKVAVVTGAAMGIGLSCAKVIAASGAKVAAVDRQPDDILRKAVEQIGNAKGYHLDVTNTPAIATTIKQIRKEMGEIDILVCSAGVDLGYPKPAEELTEEEWDKLHSVNAKGLFFSNQAVAKQSMIPRKNGSIVNISSAVGLVGAPMCMAYNTSKAAVAQITRSEAIEWGQHNVRVNSVAPTWVETALSAPLLKLPGFKEHELSKIPMNRFCTLEEIADTVCFLASDRAAMITGANVPVDGGWTAQ